MTSIAGNLQAVRQRIRSAAAACGRSPEDIRLLAVSKTWPAACVAEAADAGQVAFGENYAQEGADKVDALADRSLEWHFIGPLQSNKTRLVASRFDWVHSIDRLKIAARLSEQRDPRLPVLNLCVQVNVSGELSKSGVSPEALPELARGIAALPNLRLRGLMCIPEPTKDAALLRERFAVLRRLMESLNADGFGLDTLSMGMSHDIEPAIAEGATIVRVGTAIFGARQRAGDPQEN